MEREIRFCTTDDGVRIAYCVEGAGPDMVCCPEFVSSFSLDHLIQDQMGFWQGLWRGRRVVRYDMRGTGSSQRDVGPITHAAACRDLEAVVQASGANQFTLWASTLSGPRAIEYAVRHPDRVRRLLLHRTFARARDLMPEEQLQSFANLAQANWTTAAQFFADLPVRRDLPEAGVHQAQLYEQSASGAFVAQMLIGGFETTDVTPLLPQLEVPVLVLHRTNDPMFSFQLAQRLAAAIPHARLVPLSQGIMSFLQVGRIGEVLDVINEFIADGVTASRLGASSGTTIVLFTDVADSTGLTERMGDAAFRAASRTLDELMRKAMTECGGRPVAGRVLGDGVMGVFTSAAQAIAAALACVELSASSELRLHIGLHAGDAILEEENVYGGAVNIASRICGLCEPGEILVSQTVRDLARTSARVTFEDRGEQLLRGIEDPVRLFAVRAESA